MCNAASPPPRKHVTASEDVLGCHALRKEMLLESSGGGQGCCYASYNAQDNPRQPRINQSDTSTAPRLGIGYGGSDRLGPAREVNHLSHPISVLLQQNKEGKTKEEGPANTARQRSINPQVFSQGSEFNHWAAA